MASKDIDVPPHPSRSSSNRLIVAGALLGGIAAGVGALGTIGVGVTIGVVAAMAVGLGVWSRQIGRSVQLVNQSVNEITAGRLARADELLEVAEAEAKHGYVRRVIDLHRAITHLRRGQLEAARHRADAALSRPLGVLARTQERVHIAEAHAVRGLVRAALSDHEGAATDVAAVRSSEHAMPTASARAELALAIALERAGDRPGLREHLLRKRHVLLEFAPPRERAIVRAYQRMLRVSTTTAYREPAPREADVVDEPPLVDWVATVAPAAARFVTAPRHARTAPATVPAPVDAQAHAAAAPRFDEKPRQRLGFRVLALWTVLIVMFLAIWQLLAPEASVPVSQARPPLTSFALTWLLPVVVVATIAIALTLAVLRTRLHDRRVLSAFRRLGAGDREGAKSELMELTRTRWDVPAAQAYLQLAKLCDKAGDWAGALARSDEGIARCRKTEGSRIAASDYLLPDLHAERAVALAALGQQRDAEAELAQLAAHFPAFPHLALAELRVALVAAVRGRDLAAAARAAAQAGDDLPLSPAEELLRDVVRAAHAPQQVGAAELERLREELRTDTEARRWIELLDPGVIAALGNGTPEHDEPESADHRAELEAISEAEAEAAGRTAAVTHG